MDGLKGSSLLASYMCDMEFQQQKQKQVTFYHCSLVIDKLHMYKGFVKQMTVEAISLRFTPVNG